MSAGDQYYVNSGGYSTTAAGSITINDNASNGTVWVSNPSYDGAGNIHEHSHGGSAWTYDYIDLADKEKIAKLEKTIEMMWKLLKMMPIDSYKEQEQEILVLDKLIHPDRYPKDKENELTEKKEVHLDEDLFQI